MPIWFATALIAERTYQSLPAQQARQIAERHLGMTYVLVGAPEASQIHGYFTLFTRTVVGSVGIFHFAAESFHPDPSVSFSPHALPLTFDFMGENSVKECCFAPRRRWSRPRARWGSLLWFWARWMSRPGPGI